jgi:hypothetical protein
LVHLHTDTDANFRKEVLNHIQRLFERLKGSTGAIVKAKEKKSIQTQTRIPFSKGHVRVVENVSSGSPSDALAGSLEFTLWYTHFLECELRSTASYQRRITALKALTIVLKSGLDPDVPQGHLSKSAQGQLRWAHGLRIINPRLVRLLLDLVLDPFDDIRGASISILELCLDSIPKEIKIDALREIPKVIKRAEAMMLQTGRADHADGVARAYSLLFNQCNADLPDLLLAEPQGLWSKASILAYLTCQLEQTIELAQKDLSLAVNGRPVHGTFAALRYGNLTRNLQSLADRIDTSLIKTVSMPNWCTYRRTSSGHGKRYTIASARVSIACGRACNLCSVRTRQKDMYLRNLMKRLVSIRRRF